LRDFLKEWLPGGYFSTDIMQFLSLTDNEILTAMYDASSDTSKPGHVHAERIIKRNHFKRIYERNPDDIKLNINAASTIYKAMKNKFGPDPLRFDHKKPKSSSYDFPVLRSDNNDVVSSLSLSQTLDHIPPVSAEFIFVDPEIYADAINWLEKNKNRVIKIKGEA
jgi:hypothetical protein